MVKKRQLQHKRSSVTHGSKTKKVKKASNVKKKSSKNQNKPIVKKAIKQSSKKKKTTKKVAKQQSKKTELEKKHIEKHIKKPTEHFIPKHSLEQYTRPIGIRVLIGYMTFLAVLYIISFLSGIKLPITILFGQIISGARALFINTTLVVLIIFIIYGFWRRKAFAFDLSLAWFGFSALNSFASLALLEYNKYTVLKGLMLLSFISMLLTSGVIMWYIYSERKYFHAKHFRGHFIEEQDKIFIYTVVSFWIITLLIGLSIGFNFMSETKGMVDDTIHELKYTLPNEQQELCLQKSLTEKDICLVVVATMRNTSETTELNKICEKIDSDFYKFTCYRAIKK